MIYGELTPELLNEPHDLSDPISKLDMLSCMSVNQIQLCIAQTAIDAGFTPAEFVCFLEGHDNV